MTAQVLIQQVLLKRGNTAVASAYVGPIGEVVVDTDLHSLRVQDGLQPGGFLIANIVPAGNRLKNGIHELVLNVNGAGPYMTFPTSSNVFIGIQGSEIAAIGDEIIVTSAESAVRLSANAAGDRKSWLFSTDGNLTLPTNGTISYTPANPGDWNSPPPTTIHAALDRLAAFSPGA